MVGGGVDSSRRCLVATAKHIIRGKNRRGCCSITRDRRHRIRLQYATTAVLIFAAAPHRKERRHPDQESGSNALLLCRLRAARRTRTIAPHSNNSMTAASCCYTYRTGMISPWRLASNSSGKKQNQEQRDATVAAAGAVLRTGCLSRNL